jgi:hypothetical protein
MLITPEMVRAAREKLSVPVVLMVDETEDIILDYTVAQLQSILAQLNALAPLPHPGTEEALATHQTWMEQSEHMSNLARDAECIALAIVPEEAKEVLRQINARQLVLMGITLA